MTRRRYQTTDDVERMAAAGHAAPATGGWRKALLITFCIIGGLILAIGFLLAFVG